MNIGFKNGTRSQSVGRVWGRGFPRYIAFGCPDAGHPPRTRFKIATPGIPSGLCFQIATGALTADGVLEVGALGGVVGELDPAEPPESLLAPGRVVPLLRGGGGGHGGGQEPAARPRIPAPGPSPVPSGRRV